MASPIEGRVAKILDERTIVLNVGRAQGVAPGTIFCIYAPVEEVKDPATGESLGAWEAVKGFVEAAHPQERLSVCHAYAPRRHEAEKPEDRGTRTLSSELVAVSMLGGGPLGLAQSGRLNVDRSQLSGMPDIGPIKVGDYARSVDEAELNA